MKVIKDSKTEWVLCINTEGFYIGGNDYFKVFSKYYNKFLCYRGIIHLL
jgi:hypothetical protein